MLKVFFGDMENVIFNTTVFFKFNFEGNWLNDPDVISMINDVDNSKVLGNGAIDSPVLGIIAPTALSGGVKTLILIDKVPDRVFNASNCGDNCAKWLLKIGNKKNVTINLRHMMEFGDKPFELEILNDGIIVTSMEELIPIAGRYI